MKEEIITFRATKKTIENIESIRKQLLTTGIFEEKELTNSKIIRLAINTLEKKAKYFLWQTKKGTEFTKQKKD